MIKNISISNYALIDKTEIALEPGLTVITGETGAGKSILLGAIGLTLGQRADASAIMDKGRKCVVEIEYEVGGYGLREWFEENDLDYANCVIVRREVTAEGKSRGFINDTPVNNKVLKEFGGFMVDIHSQHQSLLLGKPGFQTDILDAFCGNDSLLLEYGKLYASYRKGVSSLEALKKRLEEAEKEEEYLRFRFNQLEEARLQVGEKEELERELDVLTHAESIKSVLGGMSWQLREEEHSVMGVLKGIVHGLEGISGFLPEAGEYLGRLESVAIELNDLADEAERKGESVEYDAGRIEAINARLNVLYDLLYKYKVDSVEDLVKLRDSLGGQLRHIEGAGGEVEEMERKLEQMAAQLKELALQIHEARVGMEGKLCEEMKRLLTGLGIRHAEFVVRIVPLEQFTPTGCDEVEFLFSANKNQQPGEIAKVASGGEISRVMLALKYVLSGKRQLPTIVFDEIDTGLSGEVAHRMAQMMKEMAERMQVISISHLPQIAAAGNCHFKVYKEDNPEMTVSRICKLSRESRIREIAGMMSGEKISTAALQAAENLLGLR